MILFLLMGVAAWRVWRLRGFAGAGFALGPPRIETCEALPFSGGGRASCCKAALSSMLLRPFCLE